MSAPSSDRPARHSWFFLVAASLILGAIPVAYRIYTRLQEGTPPLQQGSGRVEVFVHTPDRPLGEWLPIVETTDSPLRCILSGPDVPDGRSVHVNEDRTVLITDAASANKRAEREFQQGLHGWPPP